MTMKISARQCVVADVDEDVCNAFLTTNHIQGTCAGQLFRYGLYKDNELLAVMTFGYPRYNANAAFELLRLCYKKGVHIAGAAGKLFSYFLRSKEPDSVISYCNLDIFDGAVYEKLSFTKLDKPVKSTRWVKGDRWISSAQLLKYGADKLIGTTDGRNTDNREILLREGWQEQHYQTVQTYLWDSACDGIIYKITNKTNGKCYIGQSRYSDDRRWRQHKSDCLYPIDRAIQKYGAENFIYAVIDTAKTCYELCKKESQYIARLRPEYNIKTGSSRFYVSRSTEETREKMREAAKNRPLITEETRQKMSKARIGRKLSEQQRAVLIQVNTGKIVSAETKKKISAAAAARAKDPDYIAKMSEAQKGRKQSEESKDKIARANKGKHYYNNGIVTVKRTECPEGFVPGMLYKKEKENK